MITSSSWIEISESNLRHNLRFLRRHVGPKVEICSIVKANAYGHGTAEFVPLAERCGVSRFGVFSAEEAYRVLEHRSGRSGVMIMGDLDQGDLSWAVENDIEFWVFDLARLDGAARAAARCGKPARVHLELETGMHRLGLSARSLRAAARRISRHPERLQLEGVCTHFAGAESSANSHRIENQIALYRERLGILAEEGITGFRRHLSCSAAAFSIPRALGNMVRFGIAQYGFWPSTETSVQYRHLTGRSADGRLRRLLSWHSRLFNLKTVPAGEFVGYGNSYLTTQKIRLGAVPVGYFHGVERGQSNLGHVLVHGIRCPIVGIINMNMMSVDVTHVPDVAVGDLVTIIGQQGQDEITVGAFGNRSKDLTYETLARLDSNIRRTVVD